MGRVYCRIRVRNLVMVMRMNLYNAMAVRIQKRWHGYYTRKHIHNFYARKRYLEGLAIKNQIVRNELAEYQEQQMTETSKRQQEKIEKHLQFEARRQHYLLSTHQISGIYNSPFKDQPGEMEFRLKISKPLSHPKKKNATMLSSGVVDNDQLPDKPYPPKQGLPPIKNKKIQGPFKPPRDVQAQRYKPLNPSLRVATHYNSVEQARDVMKKADWTARLHDVPFMPFSKRKIAYKPLLHTTSKYGHLPYGSAYFREEKQQQNIEDQRLQTVVSPIPIFDQFGQTYSKGSVLLQ
uniref:Spermatogenesis-associated protein 17-like n=1 Tax=Phallusia mammillata TaxID=59560 RepID=A0A6F9DU23_9ASCI|nr:spermatogenesis-associated protein 17-like [Phallusia mammillata]